MGRHSAPDDDFEPSPVSPPPSRVDPATAFTWQAGRHSHGDAAEPDPVDPWQTDVLPAVDPTAPPPASRFPTQVSQPPVPQPPGAGAARAAAPSPTPLRPARPAPTPTPSAPGPNTPGMPRSAAAPVRQPTTSPPTSSPAAPASATPSPPVPEAAGHPRPTRASATHADLRLLRENPALRARCAAAVIVPFVLFVVVLVAMGHLDVFLLWIWIPAVTAGVLVGSFLDSAHRRRSRAS